MSTDETRRPLSGRGALSNRDGRFAARETTAFDDGWGTLERLREEDARPATSLLRESTRNILSRNDSPDIPFDVSINPYKGCEHGCVYCFARPSHAYLDLSPGLDFETKIVAKPEAAASLRRAFERPGYVPSVIAIGANTDPYQPFERELAITRSLLEVMDAYAHPCVIVTKSRGVLRDRELLASLAERQLVRVMFSVTTLDARLAQALEPRASSPVARLAAMRELAGEGVPVGVMVSPVIPALTDSELESILEAAHAAGASTAATILLRLPREVAGLFEEWLDEHAPDRKQHVLSLLRQAHGGELYRSEFGHRHRGAGPWADVLQRRFRIAVQRLGMTQGEGVLRTDLFQRPERAGDQLGLF